MGAMAAAAFGACTDDSDATPPGTDGGRSEASLERSICPKTEPMAGSTCLLPEGTTCDFGQCGTRIARCAQGVWRFGQNAAPKPLCPELPPDDVDCPPCWPTARTCPYRSLDCSGEDASAIASCLAGDGGVKKWSLALPCQDGGGPDVQGDAGPDAD